MIDNIINNILNKLKVYVQRVLRYLSVLFLYKTNYFSSYAIMSGWLFHTICDYKHYNLYLKPKYIIYISYSKVDLCLGKY